MKLPLELSFLNMEPSESMEQDVRNKTAKLERFSQHITACKVVIEAPHKHHHKGNLYHVRINITLPGQEIIVNRAPGEHHAHEDVYVAIRDAFNAADRQLEDFVRKQRGKVKSHESPMHGVVVKTQPDYGIIETSDGREIYFNKNSVVDDVFSELSVGNEVRFSEESGEQGPQASTVHLVGKHHILDETP